MPQVLLLRHAETSWNVEGRLQGRLESPLTEQGEQQVVHAARHLPTHFGLVVSSDLGRAHRTAQPYVDRHGTALVLDARLRERSWGDWEGRSKQELSTLDPGWRDRRPAGFETDEMVWARVRPVVDELRRHDEPVLCVGHGGVIGVIVRHLGGELGRLGNLEGIWVELEPDSHAVGDRWNELGDGVGRAVRR